MRTRYSKYLTQGACQALEDAAAPEAIAATSVFAEPERHYPEKWHDVFTGYGQSLQSSKA